MSVILHPAAENEFLEAFKWYEKQLTGLGEEFTGAIDEAIKRIQAAPLSFPLCYKTVRMAVIKNFPYKVLFTVLGSDITVIAIFHTSRNPLDWYKR